MSVCVCVRVPECACVCVRLIAARAAKDGWRIPWEITRDRHTLRGKYAASKHAYSPLFIPSSGDNPGSRAGLSWAGLGYCFAPAAAAATCSTSCSSCSSWQALPLFVLLFKLHLRQHKHLHYAESSHGTSRHTSRIYVGRIFNQFVDAAFLISTAPAALPPAAFTVTIVVCRLFLGFCLQQLQNRLWFPRIMPRFKRLFST